MIMENKFKIGDKVRTKDNLIHGMWYGAVTYEPFMKIANRCILTLPNGDNAYYLDNDYFYDESMLELVTPIREFSTGAVRDSGEGKPRMGLIPLELLKRLATHYTMGADKYGDDNWRKGQPKDATMDSLMRHLTAYRSGETDEDHLSAVIWNAFSMMNVDEHLIREHPDLDFQYKYPK